MIFKRVSLAATWMFIGSMVCASGEEPLMVLAERENARRMTIRQEVQLFTNRDLLDLPGARVSRGAFKKTGREEERKAGQRSEALQKKSESNWRVRVHEAREAMAGAVNRYHVLQLRHNQLRNLYLNSPDQLERQRLAKELASTEEELKQVAKEEKAAREEWKRLRGMAQKTEWKPGQEPSRLISITERSYAIE